MTEAIFGLIGVVVGGVMQAGASWVMERRRENWAARKAGRLLARAFGRCRFILELASEQELAWGIVSREIRVALERWPEHADVLAGTLVSDDAWGELVRAVEALERIEQRGEASPDESISEKDREVLGSITEEVWGAGFAASVIGVAGTHVSLKQRIRRIWRRIRRPNDEDEVRRLVAHSYEVEGKSPPGTD